MSGLTFISSIVKFVFVIYLINLESIMSRATLKSQSIIIAQLESQVAELTTQVGILMNSLEASNQVRADLQDERDALIIENEQLITILSEQSEVTTTVSKSQPKLIVSAAVVESAPVIKVSDFDVAMYHKFKALDRSVRLAIIEFARPQFGHVGVHNIVEVRAAWHESQAVVA